MPSSRELSQGPALDALAQAQVDIGKLETEVEHLRGDIAELKKLVENLTQQVAGVTAQLSEARGGWKMLMLMGGAGAAFGSALSWIVDHLKYAP